jgi:hypothetical protein
MGRFDVRRRIEQLDPAREYHEIYRLMGTREFPWDMTQALSFALFRTDAVPGIGRLLARTAELTGRAQKRYDDTVLILDAVLEHGPASDQGRAAIRRMNQMHRSYDIGNDGLRYVLATLVVMPIRWIDDVGRRRLTESERAHVGFDAGVRDVAESTLALPATFPPDHRLPAGPVRRISLAAVDEPLLEAFGFPRPPRALRVLVRSGLKARGRLVRFLPPRQEPTYARQLPQIRSYPSGCAVADLGTFPGGCPVPHPRGEPADQVPTPPDFTRKGQIAGPLLGYGPRSGNAPGRAGRWSGMDVSTSWPAAGALSGFRIAPTVPGGALLALAMNRRARGLRGLDVLRRSQDRAPPQLS